MFPNFIDACFTYIKMNTMLHLKNQFIGNVNNDEIGVCFSIFSIVCEDTFEVQIC